MASAAGAIKRAMEGRRHRQQHGALDSVFPGDLDRQIDRLLGAGHDDLAAAIVVGDFAQGFRRPRWLRRRFSPPAPARRRAGPPWRPRPPARPSAWPGRAGAASARRRRRTSAPAAASAEYSPSEWPATKAASRAEIHALLGIERAQGGEAHGHQGRLGVGGQLQLRGIALEHQGRELLAERRVDLLENRARRRKGVVKSLAHADSLRALARKEKCDRHVRLCLVLLQIDVGNGAACRACQGGARKSPANRRFSLDPSENSRYKARFVPRPGAERKTAFAAGFYPSSRVPAFEMFPSSLSPGSKGSAPKTNESQRRSSAARRRRMVQQRKAAPWLFTSMFSLLART